MNSKKSGRSPLLSAAVVVAALGYFVDIYDLLLFSIVRVESLQSIGLGGHELEMGAYLGNIQMTGLMIGGILWGMLGDKKGRLSVLFGSIFLYSAANFLNGYVTDFTGYALCRFFAGLGLAGELGAGITLVAEVLPTHLRGYGTMIVATIGVSGAIVGGWVAQVFDWRVAYQIGGVLGFALLLLRIGVVESGAFQKSLETNVVRGSFLKLFTSTDRLNRFALCILAGVPIWYSIGILVTYSPEFAEEFGIVGEVLASQAVMYCYLGFVIGDFLSGLISQLIKSRKKAMVGFIALNFLSALGFLFLLEGASVGWLYFFCVMLGTTGGYWAVVVTSAAEQFGTNLRATVTTSVPNFIRFSLVPMNFAFLALRPGSGMTTAALIVGVLASSLALISALGLKESFGKDLNYVEHM